MKNLIEALRYTADGIENGKLEYDWFSPDKCNCGLVMREILGGIGQTVGTWGTAAMNDYKSTGLPMRQIFKELHMAGLDVMAICELEWCGNEEVLRSMGEAHKSYRHFGSSRGFHLSGTCEDNKQNNASFVTRYMRAWADILEEERDAKLEAVESRRLPCDDSLVDNAQPLCKIRI